LEFKRKWRKKEMRLKSIIFALSCLLVLGISGNVFAVTDTQGEPLTSISGAQNVDIATANIVTSNLGNSLPEVAHIGVTMAAGSQLPALLLFDVDIDNNTATGGGSVITGIPTNACGGTPCKADAGGGFDFTITLILRQQEDGTSISNCNNCSGGAATCATRGTANDCGVDGTCYELGDSCSSGGDCYVTGNRCETGCPSIFAYPMDVLCDDAPQPSCSRGYWKGEWRVGYGQGGQVRNGNTNVAVGYSIFDETEICVEIPWGLIVSEASIRIGDAADPDHPAFDIQDVFAIATDGPKFQVTAMFNPIAPWNGTDFTCLAAKDWVPDTARVADGEYNMHAPCGHNTAGAYGNLNVDANDVTDFLNEFGRSTFFQPCPNCK
jgi:hypothetical protein